MTLQLLILMGRLSFARDPSLFLHQSAMKRKSIPPVVCLTLSRMRSTSRTNFKQKLRYTILFHYFFLFEMNNEKYVAFHKAFIILALHNRFETSRGEDCWGSSTNYTNKSVLDVDSLQSSRSLALTLERLTMRVCTQAKIYVNFSQSL